MDNIQQKLKLIDSQYVWRTDFNNQLFAHCPLAVAAIGLIGGIIFQNIFGSISIVVWSSLTALCVVIAALITSKNGLSKPLAIAYLVFASFFCLGAIRLISFAQPCVNDISKFVSQEKTLAAIRGKIISQPYIKENKQWRFAKFAHSDPASVFYLKLNSIESVDGWKKGCGTVLIQVSGGTLDLQEGDIIEASCWLERFNPATNPGQFDTAQYMARQNIFVVASVNSRAAITLLNQNSLSQFTNLKSKLRQIANNSLLVDISPETQSYGLLQALLLGQRYNIDSATYLAFQKTGLLHFISLSGLHLGILIGIIWYLCKLVGLQKRSSAAICMIAITIFIMVVPARAPTLRAAIIVWVFCASLLLRKKADPVNTLSFAALILLLIRPTQLFEAGWQLSFSCVLGIILFNNRIALFLRDNLPDIKLPSTRLFFQMVIKRSRIASGLFAMGLAAWVGGAGILLYHFHTINPFTSIWTVVAFPFVAMILAAGFLKILLASLLPSVASLLSLTADWLSVLLIKIVNIIAAASPPQILIGRVPVWLIVIYYAFVVFVGFAYFKRNRIKRAICWTVLFVFIALFAAEKYQSTHRQSLVLNCLDVGHGQAILAQLPGNKKILFDAGSLYKPDIGRKIILPFLNYSGINKIDAVVISHSDIDHINGLPEIAQAGTIGKVYGNVTLFDPAKSNGTVDTLKTAFSENGLTIEPIEKTLDIKSSASIKILWPCDQLASDTNLSANERATVSLIEFAGRKILLCSDIENFSQEQLLQLYPDLTADIVVVPHHGSINTLSPDFLKKLNADILIYSCEKARYEKLQAASQNEKAGSFYAPSHKADSFYTASDGAITIRIENSGCIKINTFKQPGVWRIENNKGKI